MATSKPTLTLHTASPTDLQSISALESFVYFDEDFDKVAFGADRASPASIQTRAEALAKPSSESKQWRITKAIVGDGTIVGSAQWSLNFKGKKQEKPHEEKEEKQKKDEGPNNGWGPTANVKFCEDVFIGADKIMEQSCNGQNYAKLHNLVVHPSYQRLGVGTMLLSEGLKIADENGMQCVLGASKQGEGLYRRFGFEILKIMELRLWEYVGGEGMGMETHVVMRRPAKMDEPDY